MHNFCSKTSMTETRGKHELLQLERSTLESYAHSGVRLPLLVLGNALQCGIDLLAVIQ